MIARPTRGLILMLGLVPAAAAAGDWPQWRGPSRDGSASAPRLFADPGSELGVVWRRPLDPGIAEIVVAGNRAYTLASGSEHDYAIALDASSGATLWRRDLDQATAFPFDGPVSTPAVVGDRLVAVTGTCKLFGLDAGTGEIAWRHDLVRAFDAEPRSYACWTSPLILDRAEGPLAVVQVGGRERHRLVAFDPATGAVAWSAAGRPSSLYSSPAAGTLGGTAQVVVQHLHETPDRGTVAGLYGVDLNRRRVLWHFAGTDDTSLYTGPTLLAGDRVLVTTTTDVRAVSIGKGGVREAWRSRDLMAEYKVALPVAAGGYVFGFGKEHLVALDAADGTTAWKEKIYPGSLIAVDGHLVILAQHTGLLRVVVASGKGYLERARLELFEPGTPSNTAPSFAAGRIYVRGRDELVAVAPRARDVPVEPRVTDLGRLGRARPRSSRPASSSTRPVAASRSPVPASRLAADPRRAYDPRRNQLACHVARAPFIARRSSPKRKESA